MIAFILLLACSDEPESVEVTEEKAQSEQQPNVTETTQPGPSVKTETPVKQKAVETVDFEIEVETIAEEKTSE